MATTSAGSLARMRAHAWWELRLLLRNGEQLLLVFVIPVALLIGLDLVGTSWLGGAVPVPTILAVSIMATAFTSLAIGTGFERRSGALEFLGTTPLTRLDLLVGKLAATLSLVLISTGVISVVGLLLGWSPTASWPAALVLAIVGCICLGAWAIAMAGALRAEAVLALANGIFVVLVMFGGVIVPPHSMPGPVGSLVALLPSGALADGFRMSLAAAGWPLPQICVLLAWALVGVLVARRTFRWEP